MRGTWDSDELFQFCADHTGPAHAPPGLGHPADRGFNLGRRPQRLEPPLSMPS